MFATAPSRAARIGSGDRACVNCVQDRRGWLGCGWHLIRSGTTAFKGLTRRSLKAVSIAEHWPRQSAIFLTAPTGHANF